MKKFNFWIVWLKGVCIVFAAFGILLALLSQTAVFDVLFNNQINPAFWGEVKPSGEIIAFQQWIYGVLGATCVGLGVMMGYVVENGLKYKYKWSFNCIVVSILSWFVIDESISVIFKVYFNAVFNLGLIAALGIPLFFLKGMMTEETTQTSRHKIQ